MRLPVIFLLLALGVARAADNHFVIGKVKDTTPWRWTFGEKLAKTLMDSTKGYYALENTSPGANWYDYSANTNGLTCNTCPLFGLSAGLGRWDFVLGSNHTFFGSNLSASVAAATNFTLMIWVNAESIPPGSGIENFPCILAISDASATTAIEIRHKPANQLSVQCHSGGTVQFRRTPRPILSNTWMHVAVVQDGVGVNTYVDGTDVDEVNHGGADAGASFSDLSGLDTFTIGSISTNSKGFANFWDGQLDEPIILDRALGATEISDYFARGRQ